MTFYTSDIDRVHKSADHLLDSFFSTTGSQCLMVGAGSLDTYTPLELVSLNASPVPKFGVNYAGFDDARGWRIWPDLWTTYDPTSRFSPHIMWSSKTMKFFRGGRQLNVVPESSYKVCDLPRTYFFDSAYQQFPTFFGGDRIVDSHDSFIQAIDIAIHLGFKELCCIGAGLRIKPSQAFLNCLTAMDVPHKGLEGVVKGSQVSDRLRDYVTAYTAKVRCSFATAIKNIEDFCASESSGTTEKQYCFDETKPLATAVTCDDHYWKNVQYLRQARKSLAHCGVTLFVEADSRLAPFFPVKDPIEFCNSNKMNLASDRTVGKYTTDIPVHTLPYHEDIKPWAGLPKTVSEAVKNKPQIREEA